MSGHEAGVRVRASVRQSVCGLQQRQTATRGLSILTFEDGPVRRLNQNPGPPTTAIDVANCDFQVTNLDGPHFAGAVPVDASACGGWHFHGRLIPAAIRVVH
jgi:hypothetical protein